MHSHGTYWHGATWHTQKFAPPTCRRHMAHKLVSHYSARIKALLPAVIWVLHRMEGRAMGWMTGSSGG